jgi:hypothetical protein
MAELATSAEVYVDGGSPFIGGIGAIIAALKEASGRVAASRGGNLRTAEAEAHYSATKMPN